MAVKYALPTHISAELSLLTQRAVPHVHELQRYQRAGGAIDPQHLDAASTALGALEDVLCDSALYPERYMEAFRQDAAAWRAAGLQSAPRWDASREATERPGDKELALYAGPAKLPNCGTDRPLFQLVIAMRDEPDSLRDLRERYPRHETTCQLTRIIAGSRQATQGQCVTLFPEHIPASSPVVAQNFAWFFMNKHTPMYQGALATIHERCGESLFLEGDPLASTQLDYEGMYETRCCWGHLHEYYHQVGPRPFRSNREYKARLYTGMLEELKVDCQSVQACIRDTELAYRWEVLELMLFDRLFRYPAARDALVNDDSGAGVLLGTWLLRHGVVRSRLVSREEVMRAIDELVDEILALEELDDGEAYVKGAEELTMSLLDPPEKPGDLYSKPADWLSSMFADGYRNDGGTVN